MTIVYSFILIFVSVIVEKMFIYRYSHSVEAIKREFDYLNLNISIQRYGYVGHGYTSCTEP